VGQTPQNCVGFTVSAQLAVNPDHISVCICTFKRAELLRRLLVCLDGQLTDGLFTYSVVVADNDSTQSAQQIVTSFSCTSRVPVTYCFEPQQNIALARNKALQHATGEMVAFIDDDESPAADWLCKLFTALKSYGASGVFGPIKPYFESDPPDWVKRGKFFDRPSHATGYKMRWHETRTGNTLFQRGILANIDPPFRPQFATAGEDMDFFRRAMELGYSFVWCQEAIVYELVLSYRCSRSYLLKRALLRGSNFPKHPTDRLKNAAKSLVAVPCYTVALPILAMFGQHLFLRYLIKLLDHASRLLAYLGVRLMARREMDGERCQA
jgi:glycosyltransferase involved in cell wall biosynthesis